MARQIAIQGIKGSFHDIAAHQYAGAAAEVVCCDTFEEVVRHAAAEDDCLGLMAIENTIAGSLLHNYELLLNHGVKVVGEYKLHIRHSIMCLPSDSWGTLTEVNSHPVALAQCRQYLEARPALKIVEAFDTAGAAEHISRLQLQGHAAICHADAARIYDMKVLEDGIEDNKHNFTRFLVISAAEDSETLSPLAASDKSMLVFTLPHASGSLSQVLSIFSFYQINLTKIQSLPIIGSEWQYMFYVDVTYDDAQRFVQSVEAVRPLTQALKILGTFRAAQ